MSRRGKTNLCAIIAVDKPAGMTSHDVVGRVRRTTGEGRVGHAGTLDPFATGVLVVCMGPATRLADAAMAQSKEYIARISFGTQTDTDDLTGEVIESLPVPEDVLQEASARKVLATFTGAIRQLPPQYSAKKLSGKKAYEIARSGEVAEVKPVEVTVNEAELLALGDADDPWWDVRFAVSKGTYIRSLARDIGIACGTRAHLSSLRRTRSGAVDLTMCLDLEEFEKSYSPGLLGLAALDPCKVIGHQALEVGDSEMARVSNGAAIEDASGLPKGECVCVTSGGRLHAVYETDGFGSLRCKIMIPGGCTGAGRS